MQGWVPQWSVGMLWGCEGTWCPRGWAAVGVALGFGVFCVCCHGKEQGCGNGSPRAASLGTGVLPLPFPSLGSQASRGQEGREDFCDSGVHWPLCLLSGLGKGVKIFPCPNWRQAESRQKPFWRDFWKARVVSLLLYKKSLVFTLMWWKFHAKGPQGFRLALVHHSIPSLGESLQMSG